jgi:hypothetical protein
VIPIHTLLATTISTTISSQQQHVNIFISLCTRAEYPAFIYILNYLISSIVITIMASFLSLPVELRLEIYRLALQDSKELTIATVLSQYPIANLSKNNISGMPANHIPVVRNGFDEKLMSFSTFAPQRWTSSAGTPSSTGSMTPYSSLESTPAAVNTTAVVAMTRTQSYFGLAQSESSPSEPEFSPYSLLATCRQVEDELKDFLARQDSAPLKLHVSFPYGLLALQHMYPALLQSTSEIHIGGFFTGEWDVMDDEESNISVSIDGSGKEPKHSGYSADNPSEKGPNVPNITYETHVASTAALNAIFDTLAPAPMRELLSTLKMMTISTFTPKQVGCRSTISTSSAPCRLAVHSIAVGCVVTWCYGNASGSGWVVHLSRNAEDKPKSRFVCSSWPVWQDGEEDWMGLVTGKRAPGVIMDWGIDVLH